MSGMIAHHESSFHMFGLSLLCFCIRLKVVGSVRCGLLNINFEWPSATLFPRFGFCMELEQRCPIGVNRILIILSRIDLGN